MAVRSGGHRRKNFLSKCENAQFQNKSELEMQIGLSYSKFLGLRSAVGLEIQTSPIEEVQFRFESH